MMGKLSDKLLSRDVVARDANTDDLPALIGLLAELFNLESDFLVNVRKQRQGLANMMELDGATVLVAITRNEIIGMCTLQPLISTAEGGTVGIVEDLIVTEKWRSKGVGSILLEKVEKRALQFGMSRLQVLMDKDNNTAKQFYLKSEWSTTQMVVRRKQFS
ncbi:MAG: GNAT family N-acetyltransferase [Ghiorsea sp.]